MPTAQEKISELIKSGNKYLLYFLFIFIFVHFVIIVPFKHPVENNAVGEASKTLEEQMAYLNRRLTKLEEEDKRSNTLIILGAKSAADTAAVNRDSIRQAQSYAIREKLIKYQKSYIEIEKQRVERSFDIPVLGISINESIILSLYPGFILIGLCLALIYRRRMLGQFIYLKDQEKQEFSFPIWAAPLPYRLKQNALKHWIYINTIGLSVYVLIIYVGIDFLMFRGNKFNNEIRTVNIFIVLIAVCVSMATLWQLVSIENGRKQRNR